VEAGCSCALDLLKETAGMRTEDRVLRKLEAAHAKRRDKGKEKSKHFT